MKTNLMRVVFRVGLIAALSCVCMAQKWPAIGTPKFNSFGGGPFDTINTGNLNVHFGIPVVHKAGRGLPFYYDIAYDSSIWAVGSVNGVATWQPVGGWGWQSQTDAATGYIPPKVLISTSGPHSCNQGGSAQGYTYTYLYPGFVDSLGTFHHVPDLSYVVDTCGGADGSQATADDGSGYKVSVPDGTVNTPSGKVMQVPVEVRSHAATVKDANGNTLTTTNGTAFTDTLGSNVLTISGAPPTQQFIYTAPGGASKYVQMNYVPKTVCTNFGDSNVKEYPPQQNVYLVSSIQLPDGTSYSFTYEPVPTSPPPQSGCSTAVTGRIASVTLPTGGTISYSYQGGTSGYNGIFPDGTTSYIARTVSPGGLWKYSRSETLPSSTTTIVDPLQDETDISFQVDGAGSGYYFETQRQAYSGTGSNKSLMLTTTTCYNRNTSNCPTTAVKAPITQVDAYRQLAGMSQSAQSERVFDNTGTLLRTAREFDYGATSASRTTTISYSTNANLWGLPACIQVTASSSPSCGLSIPGDTASLTNYNYDSTGDVLSITDWVSGPISNQKTLTRSFGGYTNGLPTTITDVNGQQATIHYDANNYCPATTFPTSIVYQGLNLSRSTVWDCNGGVPISTKDENQNPTSYGYDVMWRNNSVSYPDGGQVNTNYNLSSNPPNVSGSRVMDSSQRAVTTEVILDGLGRPVQQQLTSDPNGAVYTDTVYDAVGRVQSVSNPYYTTSNGVTQYTYDALNRVTQITRPDTTSIVSMTYTDPWQKVQDEGNGASRVTKFYQHDALGRVNTVCEVTTVSQQPSDSPTPCMTGGPKGFSSSYNFDPLGNLVSVIQGSQTRSYSYDGLSRLTSETNPEASAPTTYTYDTATGGDLYQRSQPKQNLPAGSGNWTTTYSFDSLHRMTQMASNDGTTPTVKYGYDETSPWGKTAANPKGQLTSAQVVNQSSGALINGEGFITRDTVGRVLWKLQNNPSTEFDLNYTYDYLGDIITGTNAMGVTLTNSYNTADELTSVSSSLIDTNHPGSLFSLGTYNALGALVSYSLGTSVQQSMTYNNRGAVQTVSTMGPGSGGSKTPGTGTVLFSGNEQSVQIPSTYAQGYVQIAGTEQNECPDTCPPFAWDRGTVTITLNGTDYKYSYSGTNNNGGPDTKVSIADGLTKALSGSPVNASYDSTGKISLTAKQKGACCNYSLSTSVTYLQGIGPSFTATPSGGSLTGGANATVYDTGNVSVTVGTTQETVSYGQTDSPNSIATAMANQFNGDTNSLVTATPPTGPTLTLTSKAKGSQTNYSPFTSSSSTTQGQYFSGPSFSGTPSGGSLTGGSDGEVNIYNLALGYAPNGDVLTANDNVNGNWGYGYDDFNRLGSSNLNNGQRTFTYDYDRYANRWHQNSAGGSTLYTFNVNTNQISGSGVTYDGAGNVLTDGLGHSYFYDAYNRLIQVDGTFGQCSTATACYIYDAEGNRVGKTTAGGTVSYVYDLTGNQASEVSSSGTWNRGEVYAGGLHVATYTGGTTYFNSPESLGTDRLRTGVNGLAVETCTNWPFGDNPACAGTDVSPMHFTGQQFDSEDYLTHFQFRNLSTTQGRWMTTDPAGIATANPTDPQTWNRYAYVMNNPVNFVDPLGLQCTAPDDGQVVGTALCKGNLSMFSWGQGAFDLIVAALQPWIFTPINSDGFRDPSKAFYYFPNIGLLSLLDGPTQPVTRAPQTRQRTAAHCAGQALKNNAVSLTLDAVGFIPAESTATTLFQVGVGVTSTVYSATQQDTSGSFMGIAGIQLTAFYPFAKQAGWGIAKSVPILGTGLNVVSTGKDLFAAYNDYHQCMSGH